eukprot:328493-Prorocentrum_minimum.AAC.2
METASPQRREGDLAAAAGEKSFVLFLIEAFLEYVSVPPTVQAQLRSGAIHSGASDGCLLPDLEETVIVPYEGS